MKTIRRLILITALILILSNTSLGVVSDGLPSALRAEREQATPLAAEHDVTADSTPSPSPIPSPTPSPIPSPDPSSEPEQGYAPEEPIFVQDTLTIPEATPTPPPEPAYEAEAEYADGYEAVAAAVNPLAPNPTPFVPPRNIVNPYRTAYPSPFTNGVISDARQEWSFRRNSVFQPPEGFFRYDIRLLGADYLGDISRQVVYLTFDEGYYGGFTSAILDVLKDRGVSAAFFVTGAFLRSAPHLAVRMAEEGHIVANHSNTHPDFSRLTNEQIIRELTEVEDMFRDITGRELDRFFRFPYGAYSMRALETVYNQGYNTAFWSLAFVDWDVHNQPGKEVSFRNVVDHIHNGCIILLHSVSQSNTEALPYIIDHVRFMGFEFGTIDTIWQNR